MGVNSPFTTTALAHGLFRRNLEREPQGRWSDCRHELSWPDTIVPPTAEVWTLRVLYLVALVVAQLVPASSTQHVVSASAMIALMVFTEIWTRVNIGPMWRRVGIFAVTTTLIAIAIAATPIAGIASWAGYMLYASLFTGLPMVLAISVSCVLMTATQRYGWENLAYPWWASVLAWILNVVIGVAVVVVIEARETSVLRRNQLTEDLLAERSRTARLQSQLVEQARLAGIRDERSRLARELHDTVAQGFVAVVTQLESVDEAELSDAARDRVDNAKMLAREGLGEARRAVNALRPLTLDAQPLPTAVQDQLTAFAKRNHITAVLRVDGDAHDLGGSDDTILRILQESLANIAKHAGAQHVVVTLTYLDDALLLDIRDDGDGFDVDAVRRSTHSGFGLTGMSERAQLLSGTVVVESDPGAGCVVSVSIPTERSDASKGVSQ
ncbi:two-component sensor histidine kinase [Gordonia sp. 852002-10350_SCH5691597]|nr:two-component sensor histidine kinase [Gordonia sp. 852002-10350_SCH5691597]